MVFWFLKIKQVWISPSSRKCERSSRKEAPRTVFHTVACSFGTVIVYWKLIGPISQAVIILHQWLTNHFNTFLIGHSAYKFSTVRLVLVRESCTVINTAIHKMIPLCVTVIATEMKDYISLHSCREDVIYNTVQNIYNPLLLYDHKNSFSYVFLLVLQTEEGH